MVKPVENVLSSAQSQVSRSKLSIYLELAKARLTFLVLITALVGYVVGVSGNFALIPFLSLAIGTFALASAANSLNQWWEREQDARMHRTQNRPLPAGLIEPQEALSVSLLFALGGLVLLAVGANWMTALLGALNLLIYVLVYTPLKTKSSLCTLVGAICGAIPPMMGWVAATGSMGPGGWMLAAILFVWQIPHFLALAWMYREDYERGGFRMLPVVDRGGHLTFRLIMLYSAALIPLGLAVFFGQVAGFFYMLGSFLLAGMMFVYSLRLSRTKADGDARKVFFASLVYLPLLLGLMVVDAKASPNVPQTDPSPLQSQAFVSADHAQPGANAASSPIDASL